MKPAFVPSVHLRNRSFHYCLNSRGTKEKYFYPIDGHYIFDFTLHFQSLGVVLGPETCATVQVINNTIKTVMQSFTRH